MSDIDKHISIPKNVATTDDLDYAFLRQKGLEYIEGLSSNLWTDYNSHDPGITMLEMLSYALTDLGLRIEMPLDNLLAPENNAAQKINEQFFKASHILPSKPVSELDYRKLFVDIAGVKNCWLKPYDKKLYVDCKHDKLSYKQNDFAEVNRSSVDLQGLYSIIVDFDPLSDDLFPTSALKEKEEERIINSITTRFHANRNLCEDLVTVSKVNAHPIAVCASIDLRPDADEELIQAKILHAIDNYFSPSIPFYSLQQMFDKGYTSDQIFEGPVLENGFIDPAELKSYQLRTEVRLSDIVQLIMDIDGVNLIKDISITDCTKPNDITDEWVICIEDGKKPIRCEEMEYSDDEEKTSGCEKSAYSFFKGYLPVNINCAKVKEYVKELIDAEKEEQQNASIGMEIEIPTGTYLNTSETTTIQNDFPDTYGIGQIGLPSRVGTVRKSQAKQLKAYLLFFDQVLASYFAHLGKVKDLLSVDNRLKMTYFSQAVKDIKDFETLISNYSVADSDKFSEILFSDLDKNIERKNQLLDHLIARFAEKFSDYTFLMKQLYGSYANEAVLHSKESFLSDYQVTSSSRGCAFNYYKQPFSELWNTNNVAGVQKRIARLSGMKNFDRRNLSESLVEIYDLIDSDGKKVYRWRIRDLDNEIILSATENYNSESSAEDELYQSVVKIIETPEKVILDAFEKTIVDEQEIGNFEIQVSETNKYSFDIINLEAASSSTKRIIARQFLYYDSQDELQAAILKIIKFMTTDFTEEGMFVVEHILLRPNVANINFSEDWFMPICTDDCTSCQPVDPYSYRVTVVLPGWTYRFSNPDFRNFMEELIRTEIPAHILARICWVGFRKNKVAKDEIENVEEVITETEEEEEIKSDMVLFEEKYRLFLKDITDAEQELNKNELKDLIQIISKLNSIYPSGKLIDCEDETDELEGRIILGRTNIGNL